MSKSIKEQLNGIKKALESLPSLNPGQKRKLADQLVTLFEKEGHTNTIWDVEALTLVLDIQHLTIRALHHEDGEFASEIAKRLRNLVKKEKASGDIRIKAAAMLHDVSALNNFARSEANWNSALGYLEQLKAENTLRELASNENLDPKRRKRAAISLGNLGYPDYGVKILMRILLHKDSKFPFGTQLDNETTEFLIKHAKRADLHKLIEKFNWQSSMWELEKIAEGIEKTFPELAPEAYYKLYAVVVDKKKVIEALIRLKNADYLAKIVQSEKAHNGLAYAPEMEIRTLLDNNWKMERFAETSPEALEGIRHLKNIPALVTIADDETVLPSHREKAAQYLEELGDIESAQRAWHKIVSTPNVLMIDHKLGIKKLAAFKRSDLLADIVSSQYLCWQVRWLACDALSDLGDNRVLPRLKKISETITDPHLVKKVESTIKHLEKGEAMI